MVDYYFFYGPTIDQVVAGYRTATGAAPMFPKWAYGLFQSKDKYGSQSELLAVKDGYRNNRIPLDVIVQDWDYWNPYSWGSHFMDEARYPSPATLMSNLHSANVHGMISIWPEYEYVASPRKAGDQDNYNALNAIGALYPSGGTHHFYDTFNASARTLVYRQIYDRLIGNYGWDGIWADNTEPQAYPDALNMRTVNTALGKGALSLNAYPLQHSKALYEGWRSVGPTGKRVYVLTRSAFAGQQRYATTCWSGDINSDFPTYARQIPAGLNFAIAGMPYWTTDIGGYWGHTTDWSTAANNELFTRWFQYGAFCPIFRIHGGGAREIYGNQWSATTKANLLAIDNLRYRLMPYIYSLASRVTSEGYTIMRPLVFDYQNDTNVFNLKDQFLFGPAFLVNPVTTVGATSRNAYFPAGTWYDFWTGATRGGGGTASVSAPLSQIPLFVKAGSIVPMGPMIQYATQSADPIELRVYRGRDGAFTLYEDEGDTFAYESNQSARIPITWNEAAQQLTIGARTGSFAGMQVNRTFNIVWVGAGRGTGVGVSTADQTVSYDGSAVVVSPTTASYTLAVTKAGTGAGTVASTPAGISCGSTCSASYASGTTVTLTASAGTGATFGGWSGACTGTAATCTVSMTAARSVTATFAGPQGGPVSINAGGAASGAFVADAYFSGGSTYSVTTTVDTSQLSGTIPPQSVLQTERYGEFTYTIPGLTAGSPYSVTLYFDEVYWTAAGQRTFDVAVNGATVLTAFDIFAAAGGTSRAVSRSFDITASATGQVVIAFTKGGGPDNPKVCGIAVAPRGGTSTGRLLGVQSSRCLDVPNASQSNGTKLTIWDCNGGTNQQWTQTATGAFQVYATKCLEFPSGTTAAGIQVQIWDCTGATNQQWRFNSDGTITSVATGLCLDVTGAGTANGTAVVVWTCNGGQNQRWTR
jgi:alpha-D-xyloside xylohydrolase